MTVGTTHSYHRPSAEIAIIENRGDSSLLMQGRPVTWHNLYTGLVIFPFRKAYNLFEDLEGQSAAHVGERGEGRVGGSSSRSTPSPRSLQGGISIASDKH